MEEELEIDDPRVRFLADYVLKTMKLRTDRWLKLYSTEENRQMCVDFFDKTDRMFLIFSSTQAGPLSVANMWPTEAKAKTVYFARKNRDVIPKEAPVKQILIYGDLSHSPVDQLSAFVEQVLLPVLVNKQNHGHWPKVVSDDVLKHVHSLQNRVYVLAGQIKGKTLLPLPSGTDLSSSLTASNNAAFIKEMFMLNMLTSDE